MAGLVSDAVHQTSAAAIATTTAVVAPLYVLGTAGSHQLAAAQVFTRVLHREA